MIPGNDDAARAILLYCDLASRAALDGMSAQLGAAGVDLGAMEEAPLEEALEEHVDGEVPAAAEVPAVVDAEVPAAVDAEVPAAVDALVAEAPVEAVAETEAKD